MTTVWRTTRGRMATVVEELNNEDDYADEYEKMNDLVKVITKTAISITVTLPMRTTVEIRRKTLVTTINATKASVRVKAASLTGASLVLLTRLTGTKSRRKLRQLYCFGYVSEPIRVTHIVHLKARSTFQRSALKYFVF